MFQAIAYISLFYVFFVAVAGRLRPAYHQYHATKAEKSDEVPQKMLALIHGLISANCGLLYICGWFDWSQLQLGLWFTTAYLIFDFGWSVMHHERDGEDSVMAHPIGTGIHHLMTLVFIHGALFSSSLAGCLAFFLSEIPVCFLNLTWYYFYIGRSEKREAAILSICTIVTYFLFRVCGFPLMFLFVMMPNVNWLNPFTYVILPLLVLVYAMNVQWFVKLLNKTAKLLPNLYDLRYLSKLPGIGRFL